MRTPWLALLCCALAVFSCRGKPGSGDGGDPLDDGGSNVDADAGADAGAVDAGQATIEAQLQCGTSPPVGPGFPELQRQQIDTAVFPDALCNDGTPAVFYYRPYTGAANRTKWVVNLHGGGVCESASSCAARWCNCTNTTLCPFTTEPTNFNRSTMINSGPANQKGDGIFLRGDALRPNPFGDYNQVQFIYCSSDAWSGRRRAVELTTVNPKTNAPVTYSLHFLGAKILDADLTTLRQDGVPGLTYTVGGASTAMPDLDEATEVVVTGDSAGAAGVVFNLDAVTDQLKAKNVNCTAGGACPLKVYGLMDAVIGPDISKLDFGTFVQPAIRSYDAYAASLPQLPWGQGQRHDTSCDSWHAANQPATGSRCWDLTHLVRHHITTPFFVRMALRDQLISATYLDAMFRNANMTPMTVNSFAITLHDELTAFTNLSATAEEGASISRLPGVFAPACFKHDTIHDNVETWGTTLTPAGGSAVKLLEVFSNWQNGGAPTNVLTESTTLADTFCPP